MSLLAPAALLFALLALPIVALYLLRLRRPPALVSSLLLWQRLLNEQQANAPWQRLRRNLLLLLQLLVLAALVLALARPAWPAAHALPGPLVLLLDGSASMQALDGGAAPGEGTRFAAAQAAARALLDDLAPDSPASIVLASGTPQILASGETSKLALGRAIASAQPGYGEADWETSLALAIGAASQERDATLVILSDGGLPNALLPSLDTTRLPFNLEYRQVGSSSANLAITALALRQDGANPSKTELFAALTNYAGDPRSTLLGLYAGESLLEARQVELGPGETFRLSLALPPCRAAVSQPCPGVYQARLSPPAGLSAAERATWDLLALDDQADAVYSPPSAGRTLLMTAGNTFLERLLAALPGLQPERLAVPAPAGTPSGQPQSPTLPAVDYDLYVFDGLLPADLPESGALLLLNPPDSPLLAVGATFTQTSGAQVLPGFFSQDLAWGEVHVRQARQLTAPPGMQVVVDSDGGPLLLAGEVGGRRLAVLAFDLHDSDLPLQVIFPLLFSELVDYLLESGGAQLAPGTALHPGDLLDLPPSAVPLSLLDPGGEPVELLPQPGGGSQALLAQPGVYRVQGGESEQSLAVNLFSPDESTIAPRQGLSLGGAPVASLTPEQLALREHWPWAAGAALLVLCLEFLVYWRQAIYLPARRETR